MSSPISARRTSTSAERLDAPALDIELSGNVTVMASRKLVADIAGAGELQYLDSPRVVETVSGAGSVRKLRS
jgi:hypothetical protein